MPTRRRSARLSAAASSSSSLDSIAASRNARGQSGAGTRRSRTHAGRAAHRGAAALEAPAAGGRRKATAQARAAVGGDRQADRNLNLMAEPIRADFSRIGFTLAAAIAGGFLLRSSAELESSVGIGGPGICVAVGAVLLGLHHMLEPAQK